MPSASIHTTWAVGRGKMFESGAFAQDATRPGTPLVVACGESLFCPTISFFDGTGRGQWFHNIISSYKLHERFPVLCSEVHYAG